MKKLLFCFLATLAICINTANAQIDSLRQTLNYIFQHVDKAQIPTSYLDEYGTQFAPKDAFNGQLTDSNIVGNFNLYRFIYADIASAYIQPPIAESNIIFPTYTVLPSITTVNNQVNAAIAANANTTPIALFYAQYATLREDALTQNLMTVSNGQIFDVAGRTQSPYQQKPVFAATPVVSNFYNNGTISLTYDPALFYRNTNVTISAVAIDFLDGSGFLNLPANGTINKTYTDSNGVKKFIIKATLSNNVVLQCYSAAVVLGVQSSANRYTGDDLFGRTFNVPHQAGDVFANATMQIRYSVTNPTRTTSNQLVRRPLIIVEGYDIHDAASSLAPRDYNILNLIRNTGEWPLLFINTGYDFSHDLDDVGGYDLIFINYNTMRSIQENSVMLQRAIEWVNAQKVAAGSVDQNVVIGVSAGGVLARYTLAKMTKESGTASTGTRLFISHDSPHQGANVPLGYQHFLYDFGRASILGFQISSLVTQLGDFYNLNNEPATQQLLRARVTDENGNVAYNTFMNNEYRSMITFPPPPNDPQHQPSYRFVATAQGSQCAVPVMAPNTPMANYDGPLLVARLWSVLGIPVPFLPMPIPPFVIQTKYWLYLNVNATGNAGSLISHTQIQRRIQFWGIGFGWKNCINKDRYTPANTVAWDGVPGGTQSVTGRSGGSLTSPPGGIPDLGTSFWQTAAQKYLNTFALLWYGVSISVPQDLFSFVSTTSALDAPVGIDPYTQIYTYPIVGANPSRADRFIAQERFSIVSGGTTSNFFNQNHTDFTARNALWMFNEMQNIIHPVTCDDVCELPTGSYQIQGPDVLCVSGTYTVLNVPPTANVTWPPSGYYTITPLNANSSQVIVSVTGSAQVYLTAQVSLSPGCANVITVSKQVKMGGPTAYTYVPNFSTGGNIGYLQDVNYLLTYQFPGFFSGDIHIVDNICDQYTWTKISQTGTYTATIAGSNDGKDVTATIKPQCGSAIFRMTATNTCGSYSHDYRFIADNVICFTNPTAERFTVSPVPSKNNITITSIDDFSFNAVKIVDKVGNVKKQWVLPNKSKIATLNISDLFTDVYYIQVFNGIEWIGKSINVLQ